MKTLLLFLTISLVSLAAHAQVSEGMTSINKGNQPAVIGDFNYNSDVTEYVLLGDLRDKGFGKGDESKGFRKYQDIVFNQLSNDKIDLYVKVEKNRKDKNSSTVYLLVSKNNSFVSSVTDSRIIEGARDYLNSLVPKFASRKHDLDVADQDEAVKKAEKKYNSLVSKGETLLTKKRNIEDDIIQNQKDLDEQKKELEKERNLLQILLQQKK